MLRVVTFKADSRLLEALDKLAREKRVSRSEVIREALWSYLRSNDAVDACTVVVRAASEYMRSITARLPYLAPPTMSLLEGLVREVLAALGCVGD